MVRVSVENPLVVEDFVGLDENLAVALEIVTEQYFQGRRPSPLKVQRLALINDTDTFEVGKERYLQTVLSTHRGHLQRHGGGVQVVGAVTEVDQ